MRPPRPSLARPAPLGAPTPAARAAGVRAPRGRDRPLAPRAAPAPPPDLPPHDSCALGFASVDHTAPDPATVLTVEASDYPGLVRVLAWALGGLGVTVDNARLTTTPDGLAVNTFWLLDAKGRKLSRDAADLLAERVADVVTVCAPAAPPARATRFASGGGRVTVDNGAHPTLTVVTVGPAGARCGGGGGGQAATPPPLLDVASAVSGAGLEIREAVVRGKQGGPASTDGVADPGSVRLWVCEAGAGEGKLAPARCAALAYTLELALCGAAAGAPLTAPVPGVGAVQMS